MNMADEAGAVPAGLRRRFWRTAADVWRMVNGTLSLLSLSDTGRARVGNMRKIASPKVRMMAGVGAVLLFALASGLAISLAIAQSGYPDKPIRILVGFSAG